MPHENLEQVQSEFGINIMSPPEITTILHMDHSQLLLVLRYCPASQFYGESDAKLNEQTMKFNQARQAVFNLVRQFQA